MAREFLLIPKIKFETMLKSLTADNSSPSNNYKLETKESANHVPKQHQQQEQEQEKQQQQIEQQQQKQQQQMQNPIQSGGQVDTVKQISPPPSISNIDEGAANDGASKTHSKAPHKLHVKRTVSEMESSFNRSTDQTGRNLKKKQMGQLYYKIK